ncbi:hypothetical protein PEp14_00057 [Erwinia phage PEp14]|uniref:Uncharacterized protein n=1 Tax=Erwinia phage PEp14 TaxID=1131315 RepID=H2DE87_9CAUD|nr:hypothetical protein PEp14_00057 [Erwinia phage PEp14]AEY69646.1 hypothetical protein PEp14_00057 [Erwinia phage PEp14]
MIETIAGWMLVIAICGPAPDDCRDEPVDDYFYSTKAMCENLSGKATTDPDAVCVPVEITRRVEAP